MRILLTLLLLITIQCSPRHSNFGTGNPTANPQLSTDKETNLELQASDQGREGEHYLICKEKVSIPLLNCAYGEGCRNYEKLFFIDYFIMISSTEDANRLMNFQDLETQENRLTLIVQRLVELYHRSLSMKVKLKRARGFALSFIEKKNNAMWIEDTRPPHRN